MCIRDRYGVGGIFFFSGVYLVWKTGAIDLSKSHHRTWMKVFFLGYAWFMIVHGLFTYFALQ